MIDSELDDLLGEFIDMEADLDKMLPVRYEWKITFSNHFLLQEYLHTYAMVRSTCKFAMYMILLLFLINLINSSIRKHADFLIHWLIHWLAEWLVDWSIYWLISWLIYWFLNNKQHWHIEWLIDWLIPQYSCPVPSTFRQPSLHKKSSLDRLSKPPLVQLREKKDNTVSKQWVNSE